MAAVMLAAMWDRPIATWGFVDILKLVVIIAACIAIVVIALRVFNLTIPPWAVQIFWIVIVAIVALVAINIVAGL